jgi:quercetin dioxygenase-like cupin family protein
MRALFAEAVREAASRIDGDPSVSFREERLERALVDALRARVSPGAVVGARRRFAVPDWDPQPGGVDLFVLDGARTPAVFAELKIDNIEEALWDLFKVAALANSPSAPASFLAVAAPVRRWRKPEVDCAALFPAADGAPQPWSSLALFDRYAAAWRWLLRGGRARPTTVPATIEIAFVANEPVGAYPGYELRAIEVRAITDDGRVPFDGDWPAAAEPTCAPVRALPDPKPQVVWMPGGVRTEIHLTGKDTDGSLCMLTDAPPAGWSLPPHRHRDESETIHVVEGEFEFEIDGTRSRLSVGESIHVPRGVVHSSTNVGDATGRRVVIFSPAGIERFFEETGTPTPDDAVDRAAALASAVRHGWEFVAPDPPTG